MNAKMGLEGDSEPVRGEFKTEEEEEEASSSASAPGKVKGKGPGGERGRGRGRGRGGGKASPLKQVAHQLRQKLVAARGTPCNMLQVAVELHSQAQDKHNTTLRRIYDVVNVCEGAGVLARTGPKTPEKKGNSTSDQTQLLQRYFPFRRTGKRSLRGGSSIQWVGGSSNDMLCKHGQTQNPLLEVEKGYIVDRILQKRRLCDTLSKQVAILQRLMEENQEESRSSRDQPCGWAAKRLHLPFVMLATDPAANVDICLTGDPPHEVHLELDQRYCLMDHIQMIKLLPPGRRYGLHQQALTLSE